MRHILIGRWRAGHVALFVASAHVLVACEPRCRAYERVACDCETGESGFQECALDGRSFDDCDCGTACGNGVCDPTETCTSCPGDCGTCPTVGCGDGSCARPAETCATCAVDCGSCPIASCGDSSCAGAENCSSCPADCGACTSRCASRTPTSTVPCRPVTPYAASVSSRLYSFWGTQPTFICPYYSIDATTVGVTTACGRVPPNNAVYCPLDRSISYDIDYLNYFAATTGPFSAVAFYAHEWGHLNQHVVGVIGSMSTKPIELHADCQMGIFMAHEELDGLLTGMDVMGTFDRFCAIGDPVVSPWFTPGAHGTCCERREAVRRGYVRARTLMTTEAICGLPLSQLVNDLCGDVLAGTVPVC